MPIRVAKGEPNGQSKEMSHGSGQPVTLAERLKLARSERQLTQAALAKKSGVSLRTVADLEAGSPRRPRRETLDALATTLEVSPEQFAGASLGRPPGGQSDRGGGVRQRLLRHVRGLTTPVVTVADSLVGRYAPIVEAGPQWKEAATSVIFASYHVASDDHAAVELVGLDLYSVVEYDVADWTELDPGQVISVSAELQPLDIAAPPSARIFPGPVPENFGHRWVSRLPRWPCTSAAWDIATGKSAIVPPDVTLSPLPRQIQATVRALSHNEIENSSSVEPLSMELVEPSKVSGSLTLGDAGFDEHHDRIEISLRGLLGAVAEWRLGPEGRSLRWAGGVLELAVGHFAQRFTARLQIGAPGSSEETVRLSSLHIYWITQQTDWASIESERVVAPFGVSDPTSAEVRFRAPAGATLVPTDQVGFRIGGDWLAG